MVKGTANSFGLALPRGAGWQKFPRFWNIFNRLPNQLRAPQAAVKRIPGHSVRGGWPSRR
jgi:hypothetical protein